ncbi:CPBP family intramembrane glutamic endopeptidase [Marinactinospora rubrisoli]|uniref:CPBP family intramembrane glutamic endopeptidase n=1 Tax=Marinactinospora rubrisoli TaxID=2715399 RepID=A0ABW2KGQ6_9ACTN
MTLRTRGVLVFLLLSFGLAWGGMFGAVALGWSLVDPLVQLATIAFTPAIAAVVVRRWVTREGFADAGLRPRLRSAWPYYLAALAGPPALVAATAGHAAVLGLWTPDLAPLNQAVPGVPGWLFVLLLVAAMPLLTPVYLGEEFGWTGYLRTRLFPGRPVAATVATGLVWAVWHYPLAFLGYIHFDNVVLGLGVWTVSFLLQEIVLSWLWLNSGSVWTASLAHAGNNMVWSLLNTILLTEGGGVADFAVMVVGLVPLAALCGWIILSGRLRGRSGLPGGPAAEAGDGRDTVPPVGSAVERAAGE